MLLGLFCLFTGEELSFQKLKKLGLSLFQIRAFGCLAIFPDFAWSLREVFKKAQQPPQSRRTDTKQSMENPQQEVVRVRCQRIGCNAMFTEEDNPEGSCIFHDSGPIFHDGMKEWSCCKKRSHDFSLFLEIPGCKTGKHTTEKPVLEKVVAAPKASLPAASQSPASSTPSKEICSRCRQGFFCSDHGSQAKGLNQSAAVAPAENYVEVQASPAPVKKIVDINEPQTCRNKGCGKTFKEKDNHETACIHHPGPAVFHDRMRGWKCCNVHVKEFDEFMSIPPCTKGWHDANPGS